MPIALVGTSVAVAKDRMTYRTALIAVCGLLLLRALQSMLNLGLFYDCLLVEYPRVYV
jgi:hypothetical protein